MVAACAPSTPANAKPTNAATIIPRESFIGVGKLNFLRWSAGLTTDVRGSASTPWRSADRRLKAACLSSGSVPDLRTKRIPTNEEKVNDIFAIKRRRRLLLRRAA